MFFRVIDKDAIGQLFDGLKNEYDEVCGPRVQQKSAALASVPSALASTPAALDKRSERVQTSYVYDVLGTVDELCLDHDSSLLPPKKYFLAPKERLMRYNRKNGDVFDTEAPHTTRALLGLHPCDINALLLLDLVLADGAGGGSAAGSGYVDPYWEAARASTFIVGVSCMPTATCFCKTFDADEVHRGFDLFLTDLGDRWLVSCQTVAGAAILDRYVTTRDTTPTDLADFQLRTQRYKAAFSDDSLPTTDQLPLLYDAKYEWPLFDDIGETCLSCGACSMVCPVCYCFDVRDELEADGEAGKRCRNWDSCLFSEFAEVAHGHNFRPTRASRVRYRFYHKFVGNFTRFGKMLCVGCGRCSTACKVNIDPRRIIAALEEVTADDTRQDSKQGTSQDSKQKTTSQKAHTADVV